MIKRHVVSLPIALCAAVAALAPATLEAQASHTVSTSISIDERGVPVATTVGTSASRLSPLAQPGSPPRRSAERFPSWLRARQGLPGGSEPFPGRKPAGALCG